jgi:hypothetical protein
VPVDLYRPAEAVVADLYQARYALVRPDQHVAWRGNALPHDPAALLATLCGQ